MPQRLVLRRAGRQARLLPARARGQRACGSEGNGRAVACRLWCRRTDLQPNSTPRRAAEWLVGASPLRVSGSDRRSASRPRMAMPSCGRSESVRRSTWATRPSGDPSLTATIGLVAAHRGSEKGGRCVFEHARHAALLLRVAGADITLSDDVLDQIDAIVARDRRRPVANGLQPLRARHSLPAPPTRRRPACGLALRWCPMWRGSESVAGISLRRRLDRNLREPQAG